MMLYNNNYVHALYTISEQEILSEMNELEI